MNGSAGIAISGSAAAKASARHEIDPAAVELHALS